MALDERARPGTVLLEWPPVSCAMFGGQAPAAYSPSMVDPSARSTAPSTVVLSLP
ncbi:hypothetical protein ACIBCN_23460 [Nocardia sp. NPDC051052]|uniref:hypothetical protein n=1 Tax=Nocardia sp. NPDC051052 TaxID=3364322 RepID=UPI0037A77102